MRASRHPFRPHLWPHTKVTIGRLLMLFRLPHSRFLAHLPDQLRRPCEAHPASNKPLSKSTARPGWLASERRNHQTGDAVSLCPRRPGPGFRPKPSHRRGPVNKGFGSACVALWLKPGATGGGELTGAETTCAWPRPEGPIPGSESTSRVAPGLWPIEELAPRHAQAPPSSASCPSAGSPISSHRTPWPRPSPRKRIS